MATAVQSRVKVSLEYNFAPVSTDKSNNNNMIIMGIYVFTSSGRRSDVIYFLIGLTVTHWSVNNNNPESPRSRAVVCYNERRWL